ncbi:hypothetical protein [Bradyrhizobium lablabi]|uniref:hypothetical protein n=1 Tax=Bradyrhizobium lablabi TaxID=722472 RepID=UPI001BA4A42D|nr:hypothetical protein [Bradyrhizobium lablabi]MBR0696574.1 hypothetical protein [Bradyrhizobium lablabi]
MTVQISAADYPYAFIKRHHFMMIQWPAGRLCGGPTEILLPMAVPETAKADIIRAIEGLVWHIPICPETHGILDVFVIRLVAWSGLNREERLRSMD